MEIERVKDEVVKVQENYDKGMKQHKEDTDQVMMKLLKQIKEESLMRIVLDCSFEKIESILRQAAEIGMITDYHSYIINSLVGNIICATHELVAFRNMSWMFSNLILTRKLVML